MSAGIYGSASLWSLFRAVTFLIGCLTSSAAQSDEVFETSRQDRSAALKNCSGEFKDRIIDQSSLRAVLERHRAWLSDNNGQPRQQAFSDPRRANLCGVILGPHPFDLSNVNLAFADLRGASIARSKFTGANLMWADLSYVFAAETDFSHAALNVASLEGAYLGGAKLDGATLAYANLQRSVLRATTMSDANVANADFVGAVFELEPGSLPRFSTLVLVNGLTELQFDRSQHALVELREAYKKAGLRSYERMVTYAIKHGERMKAGPVERVVDYVAFELTTKWGMVPSRALLIVLLLIVVFAIPYAAALRLGGNDGIWQVWPDSHLRKDLAEEPSGPLRVGSTRACLIGIYFSILSAFHIGWRDFNIGDWVARLQSREYGFRATGWVRSVSGLQSLISLYLVAIWALSFFGRPFE